MKTDLSPIVMFAYNRPEHTRITLEYLSKNELARDSHLFVYCDGPKSNASEEQLRNIEEVQNIASSRDWAGQVTVRSAKQNKGLAKNVMEGVSELVDEFGKLIVLEDDLKIGHGFLEYMNHGLNKYESVDSVKQVSGFLFPFVTSQQPSAFFMPVTNTIGWGTWKRAWSEIDFSAKGYQEMKTDKKLKRAFNLDGAYNYYKILIGQLEKSKNDSWAVLYWWSVFQARGLVLYPGYSLIQHNDFGSAGVHKSDFDFYDWPDWSNETETTKFPNEPSVDERRFQLHKEYLRKHTGMSFKKVLHKIGLLFKK